ncbi:DUF4179 domain-containing protein [Thalassobacillus sp. CUG 92003]|uniref:DUF4179 domain-containing protein n=1 Tax=Thalassobacillus sp. CUG 92003 TaxID=2736641 RepID=UPI0015E63750|nr:DUF4179 domain-containing protein [Thalassobacillus sp. CUG 92003]
MREKLFNEKYKDIEVPEEEVNEAIRKGIHKANDTYQDPKKFFSRTRKLIMSTAAAVTLMCSSFIVPSVSHVMADVPVVGPLYTNFNDLVGRNLASQHLITELNETATSGDINVTITSAYYDGAVMGVTFNVTGGVKEQKNGQVSGFYEIYDGDDTISDSKEIVHLNQTDSGYTGQIQLYNPNEELPDDTRFPLKFLRIGENEGVWKFDVPVRQLPHEVLNVEKESVDKKENISVHFDSIIAGRASTALNNTASFPATGENNQVRLEAYDDQGNEVNISIDGIDLGKRKENDRVIIKGRSIIPNKLKGDTDYIKIHPKVALTGKDPNKPLELPPLKISMDSF